MKKHGSAHRAARAYAGAAGQTEEFDEDILGYTDRLIEAGLIRTYDHPRRDREYGPQKWIMISDDMWFVFDKETKEQLKGPFQKKKDALRKLNVESSSYIDTGYYEVNGYYVARRGVAREKGLHIEPEETI